MPDKEVNNQYIGGFACALAMAKAAEPFGFALNFPPTGRQVCYFFFPREKVNKEASRKKVKTHLNRDLFKGMPNNITKRTSVRRNRR